MSPRYLGRENKKASEAAVGAIYCLLSNLFKIQLHLSGSYVQGSVVCWAPYLVPLPAWVPGADFRKLSGWALPTLPLSRPEGKSITA